MQYYIPQRGRPAWNAHDSDIKQAFGLDPKAKWPAEGLPVRKLVACVRGGPTLEHIDVNVWVESIEHAKAHGEFHRVKAKCPNCGKVVSAGRLHQHRCVESNPTLVQAVRASRASTLAAKQEQAKQELPLDKGFVEAVYGPMMAVWQAIAEEGLDVANNGEAIELVLDADRLSFFGQPEAHALINKALAAHGWPAVDAYLTKHVQLL